MKINLKKVSFSKMCFILFKILPYVMDLNSISFVNFIQYYLRDVVVNIHVYVKFCHCW